jgi:uncharacterized protein
LETTHQSDGQERHPETLPVAAPPRTLVVSLHDVSPHTFHDCQKALAALENIGVTQCSLLVIPDHHHRGHFLSDVDFCAWLKEQSEKGHEIVIHGYFHQRARRPGETALQKLITRSYTADEGEFYDLDRPSASALVNTARADFMKLGIDPPGFIAPAWLLSREAEAALRDCGIQYTTRLGSVLNMRNERVHKSQSLVWSVRTGWRRALSLAWNALLFRRLAASSLLRISIHPIDVRHPAIWRQITALVNRALVDRRPLSYQDWFG